MIVYIVFNTFINVSIFFIWFIGRFISAFFSNLLSLWLIHYLWIYIRVRIIQIKILNRFIINRQTINLITFGLQKFQIIFLCCGKPIWELRFILHILFINFIDLLNLYLSLLNLLFKPYRVALLILLEFKIFKVICFKLDTVKHILLNWSSHLSSFFSCISHLIYLSFIGLKQLLIKLFIINKWVTLVKINLLLFYFFI